MFALQIIMAFLDNFSGSQNYDELFFILAFLGFLGTAGLIDAFFASI
jgi:multisubunit Na+/H+ antiporter MnhF subunit